jgi:glycerol-3-phosphate acyltransferase PlsY
LPTFITLLVAYLLGSIPFGYLIVNAKTGSDIRETGSGGTGATNVSRRAGKGAGVVTLILDALKGATAVIIARWLLTDPWLIGAAGFMAIIGHIFPVWLRFRGGKGVATGVGVLALISPFPVLLSGLLFVLVVWTTRYVSLGSILGAAAIPFFTWLVGLFRPSPSLTSTLVTATAGSALIIYAHRANIRRLVRGTESKFK